MKQIFPKNAYLLQTKFVHFQKSQGYFRYHFQRKMLLQANPFVLKGSEAFPFQFEQANTIFSKLFYGRILLNKKYYTNSELLKSIYSYFDKIIEKNYKENLENEIERNLIEIYNKNISNCKYNSKDHCDRCDRMNNYRRKRNKGLSSGKKEVYVIFII